jgi:hypothetical protein
VKHRPVARMRAAVSGTSTFAVSLRRPLAQMKAVPSRDKLAEFVQWCRSHINGDEKGESQIFFDRLFKGVCRPDVLDLGKLVE